VETIAMPTGVTKRHGNGNNRAGALTAGSTDTEGRAGRLVLA
jgi:hypothetical protein